MLAGLSLISNGVFLGYPFIPCIQNMLDCCDRVYVSVDTDSTDGTEAAVDFLAAQNKNLIPVKSKWFKGVTNAEDHGLRVHQCIDAARLDGCSVVLYCQADEVIDPLEINAVKSCVDIYNSNIFLERTYFWKDLFHINRKWTLFLSRMCPLTDNIRVVEGAMTIEVDKKFKDVYVPADIARIYHYSRIGKSTDIANRLNSLRALFAEGLEQLEDYSFEEKHCFEPEFSSADIVGYGGTHPPMIDSFYNNQ